MNTESRQVLMCRIVEEYSPMLLRLAYSRLDSAADAEDCVQEVFLKLMEKTPRFRSPEHEKAWLIRVTINQASDMRRKTVGRNLPLEDAPETVSDDEPSLLSQLRLLPDKYASVLHLHYYEGYTLKEIAKLLALPTATVGTRLARGKEKLRHILEDEA